MRRKLAVSVPCGILLIFFLYITPAAEYLISEFLLCRHGYAVDKIDSPRIFKSKIIPRHLHQIFFFETDTVLPDEYREAQLSWKRRHPGFGYTLWNKTSIQDLIRRKYPHLEDLYNSYGHWVNRADVARYIVMHHHGGWYIDIDIRCKGGLHNLTSVASHKNKSIVVRKTWPWGCSNDFFGVTPQHPFFLHVLRGLFQSKRWYVLPHLTTMFSAGPTFLWGRMLNYPYQEQDVYMIFNHSQYFDLLHGHSWHSLDSKFIWLFLNFEGVVGFLVCVTIVTACVIVRKKTKFLRRRNTNRITKFFRYT